MTLLNVAEAARYIRMSQGWIRDAYKRGDLEVIHFGRMVRIQPEALDKYIAAVKAAKLEQARQWPRIAR
jgi:excisionase family DNA binding protein